MYIPAHFREEDSATLLALVRDYPLAALVSTLDGALFASHLPLLVEETEDGWMLRGHVARANPHWRAWDGVTESLAIFQGPGAYISPSHYEKEESVPTWNYAVVHARGAPRPIHADTAAEALHDLMKALIARFEPEYRAQWDRLSETYRNGMLHGIVGFEMLVSRREGKFKLSQNRIFSERESIAASLGASEDTFARDLGRLMQRR